jgi:hypothetical protein
MLASDSLDRVIAYLPQTTALEDRLTELKEKRDQLTLQKASLLLLARARPCFGPQNSEASEIRGARVAENGCIRLAWTSVNESWGKKDNCKKANGASEVVAHYGSITLPVLEFDFPVLA